jgi:hypothetical protein
VPIMEGNNSSKTKMIKRVYKTNYPHEAHPRKCALSLQLCHLYHCLPRLKGEELWSNQVKILTIATLKEMVDDKSLGLDGFMCELYKATRDFVGPNLLQGYSEAVENQSLVDFINKGIFRFIPKPGDPELITRQRPITFLNVL